MPVKGDAPALPGARASARYVRISPTKARRVVNLVRGLPAREALTVLQFAPQAASEQVYKVLASAIANAENNERLDPDALLVSEAFVDEGPQMKRFRPRAQGRAYRIRKRTSHITIAVEAVTPVARPAKKSAAPAKATKATKATDAERTSKRRHEEATQAPAKKAARMLRPEGPKHRGQADAQAYETAEEDDMGPKVHPHGSGSSSADLKSRWFADNAQGLHRRGTSRSPMISKGLERAGISNVDIERTRDRVRSPSTPGGRASSSSALRCPTLPVSSRSSPQEVLSTSSGENPESDSQLVSQGVAEQLSSRVISAGDAQAMQSA